MKSIETLRRDFGGEGLFFTSFLAGVEAFQAGKSIQDNPWIKIPTCEQFKQWEQGFADAWKDEHYSNKRV